MAKNRILRFPGWAWTMVRTPNNRRFLVYKGTRIAIDPVTESRDTKRLREYIVRRTGIAAEGHVVNDRAEDRAEEQDQ